MQYTTLTEADKLQLARDTLRARESDHFRISLLDEPNKETRLADYETEIDNLRTTVDELQSESDAAAKKLEDQYKAEAKAQAAAEAKAAKEDK